MGLHFFKMSSKTPVKILGYFIEPCFWYKKTKTNKNHGLLLLVKILGLLKSTKISGLHRIEILGLAPFKILGYFIRTMFIDAKKPMAYFACQNLGIFKENKDIGLTSYRNLRFSTCQKLGLFHKKQVFWRQKAHGLFCLSKCWDF